jgi:uncharacterized protein (DUF952 family)
MFKKISTMIFHVCTKQEWKENEAADNYAPTAFSRDGFIHACVAHQLSGVLQRYYSGATGLLLLHIEEENLEVPLRYEESTNQEKFPHIYGSVSKKAIVKIEELRP